MLIVVITTAMPMEGGETDPSLSGSWALHYMDAKLEGFQVPLYLTEDLLFLINMGFPMAPSLDSRDPSENKGETGEPAMVGYSLGYRPDKELLVDLAWFYFPENGSAEETGKRLPPGNIYPGTYLHQAWNRRMR